MSLYYSYICIIVDAIAGASPGAADRSGAESGLSQTATEHAAPSPSKSDGSTCTTTIPPPPPPTPTLTTPTNPTTPTTTLCWSFQASQCADCDLMALGCLYIPPAPAPHLLRPLAYAIFPAAYDY